MYDIIGDIHGQAQKLEKLLKKMGYVLRNGYYSHSKRKAVFVGDYIDRGPEVLRTLEIVKNMVDNGSAYAVMGNHEMNLITLLAKRLTAPKNYRPKFKLTRKHQKSFHIYKDNPEKAREMLKWLTELPLFMEFPEIRIVHACWDFELINWVSKNLKDNKIDVKFLKNTLKPGTIENKVSSVLLNGYSIKLPEKVHFFNNEKKIRSLRIKWWLNDIENLTYKQVAAKEQWDVPENKIKEGLQPENLGYPETEKPVFFGHYWRVGKPTILAKNVCCVDYGAARSTKPLIAYRFNNEKELTNRHFISHKAKNIFFLTKLFFKRAVM